MVRPNQQISKLAANDKCSGNFQAIENQKDPSDHADRIPAEQASVKASFTAR